MNFICTVKHVNIKLLKYVNNTNKYGKYSFNK